MYNCHYYMVIITTSYSNQGGDKGGIKIVCKSGIVKLEVHIKVKLASTHA